MAKNKKIIIAVAAGAILVAALLAGIIIGRSFKIAQNQQLEHSENIEQEIIMPDDIFHLAKAWDEYMSADIQQAEVALIIESKAFAFDEKFSVQAGKLNDKPLTHIRKGMLDGYIYNGTLYVDDDASFDIVGRKFTANDADIKQVLGFIYDLIKNAEFSVTEEAEQTVYQLVLTQQQIEQLLGDILNNAEELEVAVDKGTLRIVLEDNELAGVYVGCDGVVYLLGMELPLTVAVDTHTNAVNGAAISVPKDILDKMQ